MLRPAAFALAVSLAAAPVATGAERAPRLARYVLVESTKSVTAAGESASAVRGPVRVLGGTALWELESGTFPRTSANAVVMGDRGGWLVDRRVPVAARAGLDDFRALFVPRPEGEAGPFQATVRDVDVPAPAASPGSAFDGRPTTSRTLTATWSLVTSAPGRVGRVRCRLTAVIDTLDDAPAEVRSPLDDTERLFDVPAPVRDAIDARLGAVRGFPVRARVESEAEIAVDYPGAGGPPPDGRPPLKARVERRREVAELTTRAASGKDAEAFTLSGKTRVVGIERLVPPAETLR